MSVGFTFSACSLFYSVLLTMTFFSKKRIQTLENKIYGYLIVSNLIGTILAVSCYFTIINRESMLVVNDLISKALLIYYLTWISFFTAYILVISYKKENASVEGRQKHYQSVFNILTIIYLLISILVFVLPLNYYSKGSVAYSYGPSANILYVLIPIYIVVCLVAMFRNFKEIKSKKYLPLFVFITIGTIVMIIQKLNPGLLLMTSMETFVTFLMYFTIENPDIKMIDELTKAKAMVEKNNNDKSIFIFNTAQQIRHPLNMIEQRTEQILEDDNIESIREKAIDIRTSGQKISYILNGAMDVSTMDAKKIKIVENQYKIANLLNEISIKSEKEAAKKNLEFRTNFDEAMPEMLYGDSIRLKQIINALISNAIKYTQKGFVEFNVNSIISFDVCRLIISVKDSGIGVKTEEINKLFQSDNKEELDLEAVDEKDITLDIAKKMVNLIGGTITVRSEKNRGSEFTLIVDQRIVSDDNKIMDMVDEYKSLNKKFTILFVSDDEEQRTFYNKRLNSIGKVTLADNGQECLQKIRKKERYDLLIIKEKMDKLDAYKTIEKLENIEDFNSPIIILAEDKESKEVLIRKGYNAISKDITQVQLVKIINNLKKTK